MSKAVDHIVYHKDGSVWAKGKMIDGQWTTYDKKGEVFKVTSMKK